MQTWLPGLASGLSPHYGLVWHSWLLAEHSCHHWTCFAHPVWVRWGSTICQWEWCQVWTHAHNIWQVLLIEGNKIVFIIRLFSFTILQVTPNVYFCIMLALQTTAELSHFHLYGTWVHFFLHNCNMIFLISECYASVCFITPCLSNCNISWFGWYTIQRTAIYRGIP